MSNEIKQGDKVRVSKDVPKLIFGGCDMSQIVCTVCCVDKDVAAINIINDKRTEMKVWIVPTKYLVKDDAEAFRLADVVSDAGLHQDNYLNEDNKEPKIKLGDMVRVKGNLHEPFCLEADSHLEITNMPPHAVSQKKWKVIKVENRRDCAGHIYTLNRDDSFIHNIPEDCVELIEPTEQPVAGEEPCVGRINFAERIKRQQEAHQDIVDEFSSRSFDWDAYTADLAKELAIKVVNRLDNPQDVVPYAVDIAKDIVKRLKAKQ